MNLTAVKKDKVQGAHFGAQPSALTFMPLSDEAEQLCQDIDKNLFQLEKDLAYFRFIVHEIKDVTYSS